MRTRRMTTKEDLTVVNTKAILPANDENSDPSFLDCRKKLLIKRKSVIQSDNSGVYIHSNDNPKNKKVPSKTKVFASKSLGTKAVKTLPKKSSSLSSTLLNCAPLSTSSSATSSVEPVVTVFALPKTARAKGDSKWISTSPIFVADSRTPGPYDFPTRKRHLICFVCGENDDNLRKCSSPNCSTKFHEMCARLYTGGGYTFDFMSRNKGIFCSRHHCTGCFADHNRTRAFNGSLINCSQCELSWHRKCIPGGCVSDKKSEIICPRHIAFQNSPHLHIGHCADCQQKANPDERLVKCNNCLRSLHFKCFNEGDVSDLEDTEELRNLAICNWCKGFDFVRYGQYCMGRLSSSKWYPCQVVGNNEYPTKDDPLLGSVGYMVVKWLPYRNKIFYNLISHNRAIAMSEADYFFVTEAKKSDIYEEWQEAQEIATSNSPENSLPELDQLNSQYSNGELVRKITRCKYTTPETRPSKDFTQNTADRCDCSASGLEDRCGPSSNCINRTLRIECPQECEQIGKGCNNRMVSSGQDCVPVVVKPTSGRYFGAFVQKDVPAHGFVGEYVGEIITHVEKDRRIERISRLNSLEAQYYIMDLDSHRAIDAHYFGNDMRFVNHSCEPNCTVQVVATDSDIHLVLVALRKIHKGEELSFDYNMYSKTQRSVPKCRCNAKNCSGILSAQHKTLAVKRKKEEELSASNSSESNSSSKRLKSSHKKANKASKKKSAAGRPTNRERSRLNKSLQKSLLKSQVKVSKSKSYA